LLHTTAQELQIPPGKLGLRRAGTGVFSFLVRLGWVKVPSGAMLKSGTVGDLRLDVVERR